MLLPPAVKAFLKELESEVDQVCGEMAKHGGKNLRWGSQSGSIVLGNQHVAIEKPRVRSRDGQELNLETYKRFQDPSLFQEQVFAEGLKKVSQRDYQNGYQRCFYWWKKIFKLRRHHCIGRVFKWKKVCFENLSGVIRESPVLSEFIESPEKPGFADGWAVVYR